MKKKSLLFFLPFIILLTFYFKTQKKGLHGKFDRIMIPNLAITPKDTIVINPNDEVDGMILSNNTLWLNHRFYLSRYDTLLKKEDRVPIKLTSNQNPIINFYVENDSIFYYQANTRTINSFDLKNNKVLSGFDFNFPISYFLNTSKKRFLFQENELKNGYAQIHFKDYQNGLNTITRNVFPKNEENGAGMKYSGHWFSSSDEKNFFFSCFYYDYIFCFDERGNLKYKIKAIDFQNQNLEIINENNRYYLTPKANIIRLGACANSKLLFVSSYVREEKQIKGDFRRNLTIDIYQIENGKYRYSFYLPNFLGNKADQFAISEDNNLYALYGKAILTFNMTNFLQNEK